MINIDRIFCSKLNLLIINKLKFIHHEKTYSTYRIITGHI